MFRKSRCNEVFATFGKEVRTLDQLHARLTHEYVITIRHAPLHARRRRLQAPTTTPEVDESVDQSKEGTRNSRADVSLPVAIEAEEDTQVEVEGRHAHATRCDVTSVTCKPT